MSKLSVHSTLLFGSLTAKNRVATAHIISTNLRRAISISTQLKADDKGNEKSRRSRSNDAFKDLTSSLPTQPIPASTAAAKSPPFSVTRVYVAESTTSGPRGPPRDITAPRRQKPAQDKSSNTAVSRMGGGGNAKPLSEAGRAARGIASKFSARVRSEKGGVDNNRRQSKSRSLRGAPRKPRKKPWEEEIEPPYTEEETEYSDSRDGGFTTPYNPDTNADILARHRPAVISNASGIVDTLRYRLAVMTNNVSPQYRIATQHMMRIERGKGTLFEDLNQRAAAQEWKDKVESEYANYMGIPYNREEMASIPKKSHKEIIHQWVAGNYERPAPISSTDPFSYVRNYTTRNESYLPEDTNKILVKLASLLPQS